jgi:nucleoside-diphosphate-sugar epimerase
MSKKRILVCGATGFIGRNIAEAFARRDDFEVVAVHHRRPPYDCPGLRWVQADLTQPADVNRVVAGADVIVQAAAATSGSKDIVTRPYIHVTDNAVMNSLLQRAAFEHKVGHFAFFSCTVMLQSSERPQTEDAFDANRELHPRYFGVGWTKVYIEKMCEFYARLGGTRYTVIRHSNIYGPHDKFDLERSHVFGATVTKVMTAKDKITVWGTGEEARDLLYVDDLVDFVERAIRRQSAPFALYNCGYGQAIAIKELVAKIVEKSGRQLHIEHDLSQPTIKTSLSLDCSKAERELGWRPRTMLDEGIEKTIGWWRQHFSKVDPADDKHPKTA